MIQKPVTSKSAAAVKTKTAGKSNAKQGAEASGLHKLILEALDHGVIHWSANGICEMLNRGAFELLELVREYLDLFQLSRPFHYDCLVPSGRIISAKVRPMRGGGHLVTLSDVTDARKAVAALNVARAEAEKAERKAAEILADERARQRETSLLAMLDEWLQSCKSLDELYSILMTFMQKVLPGTRGQLFTYSNSRDVLEKACTWNWSPEQENVAPDSCWALRRGRTYTHDPDTLCFVCDHVKEAHGPDRGPTGLYLCVPIVAHGDTVGMLHIDFEHAEQSTEVIDAPAFTARCGEHISMAIANVKLRDELQDQSSRDPLTGLYNRRYFMNALARELTVTAAKQGNFALLSVDADHFKTFNDNHGHDAGDVVLEAIADKMLALDADNAVVCRIGGEEFSILIPACDRTKANQLAEELCHAISEMRVKYFGGALPKVTISAGIAVYPTHGTQGKELVKAADEALYAAKAAGRDQWKVAEGDGMIAF